MPRQLQDVVVTQIAFRTERQRNEHATAKYVETNNEREAEK